MYKLKTGWRVVIVLAVEAAMAFVAAWIVNHATVQGNSTLFGAILFCAGWVVLTIILAIWMVIPPETNS